MAQAPDGTYYEMAGPEGASVVVLIHGLGLNRDCWQWTIPALSDRYRVLSYDLFGHGKSVAPPNEPGLSLFSGQLAQLLDHCGIAQAAIAGFSLGGMIARRFAQDLPNRAAALIILHSPHRRTEAAQDAIVKRVEQARNEGPQATVEAALERWFTAPFRQANPDMMETVRGWVMANDKAVYHTIYRVLAEGIDEIVDPEPPITCPTLVITGDEDFGNGPEMTHAIAADISGAEALILPGLRHMALAEDPPAVNAPVRAFLDRLGAGS
jgi:pimeloyl-ACP methyl ester carboxylesterase